MKKNFDDLYEKLGGIYREEDGYLITNATLSKQIDYQIGQYRRIPIEYIKSHICGRRTELLTDGKLKARLRKITLEANEMLETKFSLYT